MAQIAEVSIGNLEGLTRIDAEYYQPKYIQSEKKVEILNGEELGTIAPFFKKGIFDIKADTYSEEGIPFIRIADILDGFVSESDIAHINYDAHKKEKKTALSSKNIVLSKTAVPRAAIVYFNECNISQDVIGIKISDDNFIPEYVDVFLNSRVGFSLMERRFQGNVQKHLSLYDAKTIRIPRLPFSFQEVIAALVQESFSKKGHAIDLQKKAEAVLLSELGLEQYLPEHTLAYETDFENILEDRRMDAEYYQPKYEVMADKIRGYKHGWKPLPELISVSKQKIDPEAEAEYGYVELADINSALGIIQNITQLQGGELPSRGRMKLKKGDVVVSSVEGSLDKVALVTQDRSDLIGSTGFFVLRSKQFNPEVNLALLKSIPIQLLLKREAQGTILTAIPEKSLSRIPVPQLPKDIQAQISELLTESHTAIVESEKLLEDAKLRVETMIEEKAKAVKAA